MTYWAKYDVVDNSVGSVNVSIVSDNQILFGYPCDSTFDCTDYKIFLKPGFYKFEAYGASGGFSDDYVTAFRRNNKCYVPGSSEIKTNVECSSLGSAAGAGGYTMGEIFISNPLDVYLSIGGQGIFGNKIQVSGTSECYLKENMNEGGYNGGGYSSNFYHASTSDRGSGSGGGSTDFRFEKNDVFHRVLVAGGGGGSDNHPGTFGSSDDGSGGAGGGRTAQGFFIDGQENKQYVATQTSGFSFGSGESAQESGSKNENGCTGSGSSGASDRAGSGGGWFGGFASHNANGGAGGGSSFVLTASAQIPSGVIPFYDSFYEKKAEEEYAFADKKKYLFDSSSMLPGVWAGNGFAVITLKKLNICTIPRKIGIFSMHAAVFVAIFI